MKKTLIALAALAATGASIAQVTITGNLTAGYQQSTTNSYDGVESLPLRQAGVIAAMAANPAFGSVANVQAALAANNAQAVAIFNAGVAGAARVATQNNASGLGVDVAEIFITAKEDIGGGQTVEAKLGLDNVSRGNGFTPHDTTLTYTNTSFGRIQYGNTRGGAVFSGLPTAGAPVIDMDEKLFERRSFSEYINYAVPVGPVTLVYQLGEATAATGLGQGQSGTPATMGQRSNMLLGLYRDGPIEAFLAYKTYDNGDSTSINGPAGLTKETQWSLQGAYDLGMAKVGFGYAYTRANVGATVADMLVGVNVPMGALEVGATYGQETVSGVAGLPASVFGSIERKLTMAEADGTARGWSLGAKYNLSKRTSIKANYAAWTRSGYAQFEAATPAAVQAALASAAAGGDEAAQAAAAQAAAAAQFGYGPIETQANVLLSHSF